MTRIAIVILAALLSLSLVAGALGADIDGGGFSGAGVGNY